MKFFLLSLLALLTTAFGDTRVLLAEDIGTTDAMISFMKLSKNQVTIELNYSTGVGYCGGDTVGNCSESKFITLPNLMREKRDVFFVTEKSKVHCGQTNGIFSLDKKNGNCVLEVIPQNVCTRWFGQNDCVEMATIYPAYLTVKD
jgi:hypothetical protein